MRDVFGEGVLGADVGHADIRSFTGFREGIVTRVEVFTLLLVSKAVF